MDGAGSRSSLRRSSTFAGSDNLPEERQSRRVIRFVSGLDMQTTLIQQADVQHDHQAYLHKDTPFSTFRNPFHSPEQQDLREESISSSLDTSAYLRPHAFAGHRDTLARLCRQRTINEYGERSSISSLSLLGSSDQAISPTFPESWDIFARTPSRHRVMPNSHGSVVDRLVSFTPLRDQLNLRLTCRQWYLALPDPPMPGSYRVPREVLQLIFSFLGPCDFDAARHTCRKWFGAGLDLYLLRSMLRSAQCQNAFKADLRKRSETLRQKNELLPEFDPSDYPMPLDPATTRGDVMSEEWLMSKRIATATRLSVDWRGPWSRKCISEGQSRFQLVEQVNFRRILIGARFSDFGDDEKTFSVSTCGKYLLVRSGCDIFVYNIGASGDSMAAVVRLAAEKDVLRASMDTSSGRFAVAALLENRVGVLWDLNDGQEDGLSRFHSGEPMSLGMRTEVHGSRLHDRCESLTGHLPLRRGEISSRLAVESYESAMAACERSEPGRAALVVPESHQDLLEPLFDASASFCATPDSQSEHASRSTGVTIQTRPSATFYNLGSSDDTPRSVAICPSRKCVAFGCRLGIELHWVDALTGGDLNRWFPLAAPSDHLYFLPQRSDIDSGKKLRLISSAAGPSTPSVSRSESLPARLKIRSKTHDRGRRQSMTRLFFGSLPFPSAAVFPNGWRNDNIPSDEDRQGVLRTVDCDHYQAVPLSDGYHVLYTDPVSGLLCLGSDAPLGGPTKLVRKAVFDPPTVGEDGWAGLMSCYNAGQELAWGVRIVAAHRDGRLVLYNVPADLFGMIRHLRSSHDVWDERSGVLAQSDLLMDDILTANVNTSTDPMLGNAASQSEPESPLRTVQIEGVEIGHVGRDIVDDVTVDTSNGGVRVWVFCRSGLAKLLDIYIGTDHRVRNRFVGSDGLLYDAEAPSVQGEGEGRHSPKGKERAHSKDEDSIDPKPLINVLGYDGTLEEAKEQAAEDKARKTQWQTCSVCKAIKGRGPEKLHVEIVASSRPPFEEAEAGPFEIEILTDWLDECLFAPYVAILD